MMSDSNSDETTISKPVRPASVRPVNEISDYSGLNPGDHIDHKTISSLIFKSRCCIVYMDENNNIYWETNEDYDRDEDYAKDFGAVLSRYDLLNSTPDDLLRPKQQRAFKRQLGVAMARVLDDRSSENAKPILDQAEAYLRTRTTERARIWFLSSASIVAGLALLIIMILGLGRPYVVQLIDATTYDIILGTLIGGPGAVLSMILRVNKLDIDAMAGAFVHYFEGAIKVVGGMGGALLVALAVKANLLLGTINATDKNLPLLLAVCFIAGASERLVPNLIKKVEGTLVVDGAEKE